MRSRKSANVQVAEVARQRLELLSAELAEIRRASAGPTGTADDPEHDGSGEPSPGRHAARPGPAGPAVPATPAMPAMPAMPSPPSMPGRVQNASGWLRDRLPPALSGGLQLGASHLTVIAILVALAFAVTAWSVMRADGSAVRVRAATPHAAAPPSAPSPQALVSAAAVASASASPTGTVVVDVAGKVRRPGIARLPAGSRVVDALRAAGGARRGVDLAGLNLARILVDGEQILVGVPPAAGVAASALSTPGATSTAAPIVNINTAYEVELESLPEVGPVTAQAIMDWRAQHGSFSSVDQLLDVRGIGDATLAQIAPFVTL